MAKQNPSSPVDEQYLMSVIAGGFSTKKETPEPVTLQPKEPEEKHEEDEAAAPEEKTNVGEKPREPAKRKRGNVAGYETVFLQRGELKARHHGAFVHAAGIVTQRQRPATAKGTIFVTLEDEDGMVNVVVWADLASRHRKALLGSTLMGVRGRWEQVDGVSHLIAGHIEDLSPMLGGLRAESRDFH